VLDAKADQKSPIEGVDRKSSTCFNGNSALKGVLTGDALVNWVVKSCLAQRVPVKVTDPRAVDRVSTLLSGTPAAPPS